MRPPTARKPSKQRLDVVVCRRGLAHSRHAARALLMSGRVSIAGRRMEKPGSLVSPDAEITVTPAARSYASRGGFKLAGAIDHFGIDVRGMSAIDIGASSGGFTDCLLQKGAKHVVALDVGHGQIDWVLRQDPRVHVLEGCNARYLTAADLPEDSGSFDLATIDVSFISLRLILPAVLPLVRDPIAGTGHVLSLVKPQFEVGRGQVGRGGIVRQASLRCETLAAIAIFAKGIGFEVLGLIGSSLRGARGNHEYFIHLHAFSAGLTEEEIHRHAAEVTQKERDSL